MSALDKIAELHVAQYEYDDTSDRFCIICDEPWPCPTRRLCDEAAEVEPALAIGLAKEAMAVGAAAERVILTSEGNIPAQLLERLEAVRTDLHRARQDADRLATAALAVLTAEAAYDRGFPPDHPLEVARREMLAALAAHYALTGGSE